MQRLPLRRSPKTTQRGSAHDGGSDCGKASTGGLSGAVGPAKLWRCHARRHIGIEKIGEGFDAARIGYGIGVHDGYVFRVETPDADIHIRREADRTLVDMNTHPAPSDKGGAFVIGEVVDDDHRVALSFESVETPWKVLVGAVDYDHSADPPGGLVGHPDFTHESELYPATTFLRANGVALASHPHHRKTLLTTKPDAIRWRVAVSYWKDDGHYPRASRDGSGDPYLRACTVMTASLRRLVSNATVEIHTNLDAGAPGMDALTSAGAALVPTPFEHRMPEGYFQKFTASTYAIDVLAALSERVGDDEVALLVDPDVVWLRSPQALVDRTETSGLLAYPIPYPADFEDLAFTRRRLSDLAVEMTGCPVGPDGLIAHLGGEFLAGTQTELERFATASSRLWEQSLQRFHDGRPPWLHTEEHVYSVAFHSLGYSDAQLTDAIRRVWTRPGRLRNVRPDDVGRTAWHALAEKGRGLDRLYEDHLASQGAFDPSISDEEFILRVARRLSIHPSPIDRLAFIGSRINARLRGRRRVAMPA